MSQISIHARTQCSPRPGPRFMNADCALDLRMDVSRAVRRADQDTPTLTGWLALDCAQVLLETARAELAPRLTPGQSEELTFLAYRLRALTTDV